MTPAAGPRTRSDEHTTISRQAGTNGAGEVGALLAGAFADDPVMRWMARFDGDMSGRVRPRQGRGYGIAVLRPMLDRCDEEGVAAYLENSNPRNDAFYVRHGFAPRAPIELPSGAPPLVPMLRSPR